MNDSSFGLSAPSAMRLIGGAAVVRRQRVCSLVLVIPFYKVYVDIAT